MFEFLPLPFLQVTAFLFGCIIGSFLNVVIYRLHTSKSLNDRSHCLSCNKGLAWYELFPLFSYLCLRGRCLGCGAGIPSRYFIVELLAGVLFTIIVSTISDFMVILLLCALVSVLIVGAVYDVYHMIIPNEVVAYATVFVGLLKLYESYLTNNYQLLLQAIMSGAIATAFFWLLWKISQGRWIGFGDVKLAFPLGALVGLGTVFSFIVLSFWVGAILSVVLLSAQAMYRRGKKHLRFMPTKLTMKSEIPFAPFMCIATGLVYFFGVDVLAITTTIIESFYASII